MGTTIVRAFLPEGSSQLPEAVDNYHVLLLDAVSFLIGEALALTRPISLLEKTESLIVKVMHECFPEHL